MDNISPDNLLTIIEAAELRQTTPTNVTRALRVGELVAWRDERPILLSRAVVEAWTVRKRGRPGGNPPSANIKRIGGTRLELTASEAAKLFGESRQTIEWARRRMAAYREYHANKAKMNGKKKSVGKRK